MAEDLQDVLRIVEAHAVLGRNEVPHELGGAVEVAGLIQQGSVGLGIGGGELDGIDRIDDGVLGGGLGVGDLLLDLVDAADHVIGVGVALTAGLLRVEQRAMDIVGGELGGAIAHVGHMAIGTGHTGEIVGAASGVHLVLGMLGFQHGGAGAGIVPVLELDLVIIRDDLIDISVPFAHGKFRTLWSPAK